jgi:hypothetical protein
LTEFTFQVAIRTRSAYGAIRGDGGAAAPVTRFS